jgi:colicin import membrane protein
MSLLVTRSIFLSVLVHAVAVVLLIFSLDFEPEPIQAFIPPGEIIDATAIDSKQVEQEVAQLKELEQKKVDQQRELQQKVQELERQSRTAEQRRREEEVRLADVQKQKAAEEQKRKEEELKLADVQKKQEELKRQAEVEQKRLQEAQAQAEAEKKKKEAEEALKKQLAAEQAQQAAAQDKADMNVINQYVARIAGAIQGQFNTAGLEPGLSCVLQIRMLTGGEVTDARITKSSGNAIFDSRAIAAVQLASPLPVPDDARIFGKMREIRLTFKP